MLQAQLMIDAHPNPLHAMPSGLCEDATGEATALIKRMAQGDKRALEDLFAWWAPVFSGISHRIFSEHKAADQVVRDTFVRMWRRSADYDPHKSPPFVWAFTILRDLCIDHLHRRQKPGAGPQRMPVSASRPEVPENPQVMPPDDWHRLKAAMNLLSPDELSCLETAVLLGYARSAAPGQGDAPSATVKTCIRRALEKIRIPLSRYEL